MSESRTGSSAPTFPSTYSGNVTEDYRDTGVEFSTELVRGPCKVKGGQGFASIVPDSLEERPPVASTFPSVSRSSGVGVPVGTRVGRGGSPCFPQSPVPAVPTLCRRTTGISRGTQGESGTRPQPESSSDRPWDSKVRKRGPPRPPSVLVGSVRWVHPSAPPSCRVPESPRRREEPAGVLASGDSEGIFAGSQDPSTDVDPEYRRGSDG